MLSRTTLWRRRCRAKDFINERISNNVSLGNYNDNEIEFYNWNSIESNEIPANQGNDHDNILHNEHIRSSINEEKEIDSNEDIREQYKSNDFDNTSASEDEKEVDEEEIFNLSTEATTIEIATTLIVLKVRHRLSNRCIDHLCQLMRLLKTPKVPSNFKHIKRLLESQTTNNLITPCFYCSTCKSMSHNENKCSNTNCTQSKGFSEKPSVFVRMPLRPQLQDILSQYPSNYFQKSSYKKCDYPSDISQGELYKYIVKQEDDNFISLVMNVDGIEIAKSSKSSLWIITFIINEFEKRERFHMQNVLVAGIGAGRSKPTREEMAMYLNPIINELLVLEHEHRYRTSDDDYLFLKVFLIAGSFDKPAQAIVQNIAEPNGAYGCGKCCIMGITVPIKENSLKRIRVFPIRRGDNHPKLRSNFTYDIKMAIPENYRPTGKNDRRDFMCGFLGECCLRELRYFDVGRCFAFDTLHNLYRGTFSRMLDLWFQAEYRHQPWSLYSKIELIDINLSTHKFHSTTYRIPRSILKYHQFKANELRSVLLFGFSSFYFLPRKYYRHFLLLVITAHLCESISISPDQITYIKHLTNEFIYQFPLLYGDRQNVMCVHTIMHLADSIRDFGGVYNYSTFNFENYLGKLRETIHSTRRHALEVQSNINLLRSSCQHVNDKLFNFRLFHFIKRVQPEVLNDRPFQVEQSTVMKKIDNNKYRNEQARSIFGNNVILYKSIIFQGVRFTTFTYQTNGNRDDSCVLYKETKKIRSGFITSIIKTSANENECIIQIRDAPINRYLSISLNGTSITCSTVMFSSSEQTNSSFFVRPNAIIEKLAYVFDNSAKVFILFRFPNMIESS